MNPGRDKRLAGDLISYAIGLGASLGIVLSGSVVLAAGLHLACRLAYVLFTGLSLRAQSPRLGREPGSRGERRYGVFRRRVVRLQNIDALSFVVLCVVTRRTLADEGMILALGAILVPAGVGMKAWAVRCLGPGSYTWHDFFVSPERFEPCTRGPYRFIRDPMYTVGYLHAYGIALLFLSWPALLGALFDQGAILLMSEGVEKPHFLRLCARRVPPEVSLHRTS